MPTDERGPAMARSAAKGSAATAAPAAERLRKRRRSMLMRRLSVKRAARFKLRASHRVPGWDVPYGKQILAGSGPVEAVEVHPLGPRRDEILHEFLLRVRGRVDFRQRAKLRV